MTEPLWKLRKLFLALTEMGRLIWAIMPTHPHQAGITRILKSSPACQNSYLVTRISALPNISMSNERSKVVNAAFFTSQIRETAFQNDSHTYTIDKDMPLTFWLYVTFTISFSLLVFSTEIPLKVSESAECNMTDILRAFIISDLWNYSKAWEKRLKYLSILHEATVG